MAGKVNLSKIFILRPVATTLLAIAIMLAGAVAYFQLPVSALPEVDYPTIQVLTFYPGASPNVVATGITAPLEVQFGQMAGLKQMRSTSSFGCSVIVLQFDLNLNIDVGEQEVQEAINAASSFLPDNLPNPPVYSKVNPADPPILTLGYFLKNHPSHASRRPCRYKTGPENLSALRSWTCQHKRWTETSSKNPGKSAGAGSLWFNS